MATSVKFGLTLPNRMVILGVGSIQDIISMGVDAEETGLFQSLWVGDSILAKRRPESVALLGAPHSTVRGFSTRTATAKFRRERCPTASPTIPPSPMR